MHKTRVENFHPEELDWYRRLKYFSSLNALLYFFGVHFGIDLYIINFYRRKLFNFSLG